MAGKQWSGCLNPGMMPKTSLRAGRCTGLWKGLASSRAGGHKGQGFWGSGLVVRKATSGGEQAQWEAGVWRQTGISGRGNSVSAEAGRQEACVRRRDGRQQATYSGEGAAAWPGALGTHWGPPGPRLTLVSGEMGPNQVCEE